MSPRRRHGDLTAMSQSGRRCNIRRLLHKSRTFVQMRCRGDIAVGSLGDFHTKNCILHGDILATSMRCRNGIADRYLGDFHIKVAF